MVDRSSATELPMSPCSTPGFRPTARSTASCGLVTTESTCKDHAA
ncbi:hypothetical protein ACFPM0_21405 [Pseudonocardia sulfidoxydans]